MERNPGVARKCDATAAYLSRAMMEGELRAVQRAVSRKIDFEVAVLVKPGHILVAGTSATLKRVPPRH